MESGTCLPECAAERATFEAMMDKTIDPAVMGYDRRRFEFPLRATELRFADSKNHLPLRVANLLAGTTAYHASAMARSARDDFSNALYETGVERFRVGALWPSPDGTPEALGTDEEGGINAVDSMVASLAERLI